MKISDVPQRGSRGRVVASRNRFGQFLRERVSPNQPGTPAQREAWGSMTDLSRIWNELTEERWAAWRQLAAEVESRPNLNQSGALDGCQLFKKLNRVLATCGREPLLDPPPLPMFGSNVVEGFTISNGRRGPVFKLRISPGADEDAGAAMGDFMIYSWAPFNAGVGQNDLYAFLGLLRALKGTECDFTAQYLRKLKEWRKLKDKRYHLRLEGSRVFVRVWQQVNGWVNEVGLFQASALVPVDGSRWRVPGRRYAGKRPQQ